MTMKDVGNAIAFISSNWAVFLGLFSVLAAVIGRVFYGLSIFQPLEEIAQRQKDRRGQEEQERYKRRMVARHIELGNAFLDANQLEAARTDFEHALKLDPNNMEAQMGVLKSQIFEPILHNRFDPEIAEKRLQVILKENPNDKHVLRVLGDVYQQVDQETALEYYNRALEQDRSLPSVYNNIGYVYQMQGKPDEALKKYQKALELSPWNLTYINNLGNQYLLREKYKEAIERFEEALSWDDHLVLTWLNLAQANRLLGDFEGAYEADKRLPGLVQDEDTMADSKNRGNWLFATPPEGSVQFYSLSQKQCYAYYSIALSSFLTGRQQDFQVYVKEAQELQVDDRTPVDAFMYSHVTKLGNVHEALASTLEEFQKQLYSVQVTERPDPSHSASS